MEEDMDKESEPNQLNELIVRYTIEREIMRT